MEIIEDSEKRGPRCLNDHCERDVLFHYFCSADCAVNYAFKRANEDNIMWCSEHAHWFEAMTGTTTCPRNFRLQTLEEFEERINAKG